MRYLIIVTIVACAAQLANVNGADLTGSWKGVWTKDGDALPVTVTFDKTATGYTGSFCSAALQVVDIPLPEVSEKDGRVLFLLRGDNSTTRFIGSLAGDVLAGTMDGSDEGTFTLTRATLHTFRKREVSFSGEGVQLAGTLTLPSAAGKHGAIIFLQGSGPEGRWANAYLAQAVAEVGMVALIYDKRGVGKSTGDWQKVGFEALARDGVAGVRFLQEQAEVDPARVGIYGHSQGGTIAPMVATEAGNVAFVIASAAGGLKPDKVETYSVENSIGIKGLLPDDQNDAGTYVREMIDVAFHAKDRAALNLMAAKFKNRPWFFAPPPADNFYWSISRQIASYDPTHWWRQVKAAVLLVYGAKDERVPSVEGARAIEDALKAGGNNRVTVKVYPEADHTFTVVDPKKRKGGWPKHEPGYAATLTNWVHRILEE